MARKIFQPGPPGSPITMIGLYALWKMLRRIKPIEMLSGLVFEKLSVMTQIWLFQFSIELKIQKTSALKRS